MRRQQSDRPSALALTALHTHTNTHHRRDACSCSIRCLLQLRQKRPCLQSSQHTSRTNTRRRTFFVCVSIQILPGLRGGTVITRGPSFEIAHCGGGGRYSPGYSATASNSSTLHVILSCYPALIPEIRDLLSSTALSFP